MNNERIASELVKAAKALLAGDDKTEAYEKLLKEVSRGQAILTAGELVVGRCVVRETSRGVL